MAKVKSVKEVVKEVKAGFTFNKETCTKLISTFEYLMAPLAAMLAGISAIWGISIDLSLYTTAFLGMLASIFTFIKLFLKD